MACIYVMFLRKDDDRQCIQRHGEICGSGMVFGRKSFTLQSEKERNRVSRDVLALAREGSARARRTGKVRIIHYVMIEILWFFESTIWIAQEGIGK